MGKIISIANHKGGVGKTTTTVNLGKALSLLGNRVLLVDIDPQSNTSQSLGVEEPLKNVMHTLKSGEDLPIIEIGANYHLVPADLDLAAAEQSLQSDVNGYFRLRNALAKVKDSYDYILIDCPPNLAILTLNAMIASDSILIVIQAEYLAVKGLRTVQQTIGQLRENLNPKLEILGVLITQFDRRTTLKRAISDNVTETFANLAFKTRIRHNITLSEAALDNKDIFSYSEKSNGAEDYMRLAHEIVAKGQG